MEQNLLPFGTNSCTSAEMAQQRMMDLDQHYNTMSKRGLPANWQCAGRDFGPGTAGALSPDYDLPAKASSGADGLLSLTRPKGATFS